MSWHNNNNNNNQLYYFLGTSVCPPSPCTSWPTTSTTSVNSVAKLSPGRGCCRGTSGHTRGTSPTRAMSAENHLRTDLTSGLTCKHIRRRKTSRVTVVRSHLRWNLISISIWSLRVTKYSPEIVSPSSLKDCSIVRRRF